MSNSEIHVYLAGPDVFLPDPKGIAARKKAHLAQLGMIGHFPLDNILPEQQPGDVKGLARAIAAANEDAMRALLVPGRIPVILVNMMPWYGPSMDVGTAFEAGFMSALAYSHAHMIIVGYTEDVRPFEARVIAHLCGDEAPQMRDGIPYAPDGTMIEAFGLADNLMITHAIEKTGGRVCASFEEAARLAKTLAERPSGSR
jgi:nucleoside 2-deoxyribosyltransferase